MNTKVFLFTSLKGGCGVSMSCANVACALAKQNKKVLLVSFNRYCTSVDMLFGMESSFVLDMNDYRESGLLDICLPVTGKENLFLTVRSAFSKDNTDFSETDFLRFVSESGMFDFILVDKTEGTVDEIIGVAAASDTSVIVSTQMNDSIRCAELLGNILKSKITDADIKLLLNSFYTDIRSVGLFSSINEILERTGIPLLGAIPFSDILHAAQTNAYSTNDTEICAAYTNVCLRILGKDIKLFDFLPTKNRRKLLNS